MNRTEKRGMTARRARRGRRDNQLCAVPMVRLLWNGSTRGTIGREGTTKGSPHLKRTESFSAYSAGHSLCTVVCTGSQRTDQ